MPATDILNPTAIWEANIQDSLCPNYGFTRKRATTQLRKKAVGGRPWVRETANTGHSFNLSWMGRTWACVQILKRYYEQYERGYFTIIDWDGGGRHYVGRFTSAVVPVETGNGMWDVQNVTFEEMPQIAMVKYPCDWDHDAIRCYAFNDDGDQDLAASGDWTATAHSFQGVAITTMDDPGNNGDWVQYEYRGYGFKLFLLKGPTFGKCQVLLDTVLVATVDCYAAAAIGPQMVCLQQNVPLDIHRVQVLALHTQNVDATGFNISWHSLQVMR